MGQKVNPHGIRVGVIKYWDSQWYEEPEFADDKVELENSNSVSKIGKIRDWDAKFQLTAKTKMCRFNCTKLREFIKAVICDVKKRLILPRQRLLT